MHNLYNYCKQYRPLVMICLFLICIGLLLVAGGSLNGVVGVGSHQLNGWERLLGFIPIILGVFVLWAGYPQNSNNNEKK